MATPILYQNITTAVDEQLLEAQEAENIINLTDVKVVDDPVVVTQIMKFLGEVGKASLSAELWDPAKTKMDIDVMTMDRLSCDIEGTFIYEDWKSLIKQGAMDSGMVKIGKQPAIQASHYLFQGTELLNDNSKGVRPLVRAGQYNFLTDIGAATLASTINRPIGVNQVSGTPNTWPATAGAWATYANMATDINQIESLFTFDFNRDTTYCFYPKAASPAMGKKRTAGTGDGFRNAFMELEDHGISKDRVIPIDNRYMYTRAGASPTNALFDLIFVDMKSIRTFLTVAPFVNSYVDNSGKRFPDMTVEAGLTMTPVFKPNYDISNSKWRKGVAVVRAIVGT